MLLKMSGQEPLYSETENEHSGVVRADQFYGKGLATSAAEYLSQRKQACQPEEILRGLETGGFDFDVMGWKESDRLRSLAISLAKNTGGSGQFHRLKNGTFGLRSWYDEDFLKKAASSAADALTAKVTKKRPRGTKEKSKARTKAKSKIELNVKEMKAPVKATAKSKDEKVVDELKQA